MKQLRVSGQLNTEHVKKLVKAFYRNDNVVVFDEENMSNTIKRKLTTDKIDGIIDIVAKEGSMSICVNDSEGKLLYEKRENTSDYSLVNVERFIYHSLCEYRGITLPWGTMTGVHPIRPVYLNLLGNQECGQEEEFLREYRERYLISDKKTQLIKKVARNEKEALLGYDYEHRYSLYIGIPFCPTTCIYCSFTSFSLEKYADMIEVYLDALIKEVKVKAKHIREYNILNHSYNRSPLCVYIGGGTPTSLSAVQLDRLFGEIESNFDLTGTVEYCVEAGRPDTIDEEKLRVMKKHNVTRISVNPQTMNDNTLGIIGRRHSVKDIIRVYHMARDMGFDNINMDLIMGLTGEDEKDAAATALYITSLKPENITVHTLALKRAAIMNQKPEAYNGKQDGDVDKMMDIVYEILEEKGYYPYYLYRQKNQSDGLENTGFTLKGKECLYNILTMEELGCVIALGAGAISKYVEYGSKISIKREDNVKSLFDYIKKIDEIAGC